MLLNRIFRPKTSDATAALKSFLLLSAGLNLLAATVVPAIEPLTLLPAPWPDREQLQFELKSTPGYRIGAAFYTLTTGAFNGREIWQLNSRAFAGVHSWSRVEADTRTFQPLHSHRKHALKGDVEANYTNNTALLKIRGNPDSRTVKFEGMVYDSEQMLPFFRRLPLTNGYTANLEVISTLAGGSIVSVQLQVTGPEPVRVPAGSFDCFRVELPELHERFWYSIDSQKLPIKYESGGVLAELVEKPHPKRGQLEKYVEPDFGFSLVIPDDWRVYRAEPDAHNPNAALVLLDKEAIADCWLRVQLQSTLTPSEAGSLRLFAESRLRHQPNRLEIGPDSWQPVKLAGHPALSVTADYLQGKEKRTVFAVFSFGAVNAAWFNLDIAADDFAAFRSQFDVLLEGYKAN